MEELSPSSLGDGTSEEELQAVFGEQGLLILGEEENEDEEDKWEEEGK